MAETQGEARGPGHALLHEHETMQNVALCAFALSAAAHGFRQTAPPSVVGLNLWHCFSVLPLVLHDVSRRAITKRRTASGLRSILARDPAVNLGQNEAILNLSRRMHDMRSRTVRAINLCLAWGLLKLDDGYLAPGERFSVPKDAAGETREILRAAEKLGKWAGQSSAFEYLTVLGIDPSR